VKQKPFCNKGLKGHTRLQVNGSEAQLLVNLGRSRTSVSNHRQTYPFAREHRRHRRHQCSL